MPVKIDREQIYQEEMSKIKNSNLFLGVQSREDYFGFEGIQKRELNQELVDVDSELKIAVEQEKMGYSKQNMTMQEINEEKRMFEQHEYNLDFMLEDQHLHDNKEL